MAHFLYEHWLLVVLAAVPGIAAAVYFGYRAVMAERSSLEKSQDPIAIAEITTSSDTIELANICDFVRDFCAGAPLAVLDENGVNMLELAVNEAASDIMKNSYNWRANERIEIVAKAYEGCIIVLLYHYGQKLKAAHSPDALQVESAEVSDISQFIMHNSVDEIMYGVDELGRNYTCLVKRKNVNANEECVSKFIVEKNGEIGIVALPYGLLDLSNTQSFMQEITPVLQSNKYLMFDLSKVKYLDSSGLGAILFCLWQMTPGGGDMKLCGVSKKLRSIFEIVRMNNVFDIYETREDCLAAFREQISSKKKEARHRGSELKKAS